MRLRFSGRVALGVLLLAGLAAGRGAHAHTPLFACYDNGDGTIMCEGGFSDGSSASGVPIKVRDAKGAVVAEGKMNANSEFEFKKPAGVYSVVFEGGEGHSIEIPGKDIVK